LTVAPAQISQTYQASVDFSSRQGYRGWSYLSSNGALMSFDTVAGDWKGADESLLLWSNGGHPGIALDAVRRWTAPQPATIRIMGSAHDADSSCGDGVTLSIRKGSGVLWQATIPNGGVAGVTYDLTTTVATGDAIDFAINSRANNSCDSTVFDPKIVVMAPLPSLFSFSLGSSGGVTSQAGKSGRTTITASLVAGAPQSVTFSATGLPSGVTASFSPVSCVATCSTTLTLTASPSAAIGSFMVQVTGAGGGSSRTTSVPYTVTAAPLGIPTSQAHVGSSSRDVRDP